ncbi:hypothetical protein F5I97DRAFT_2069731 [Phlebopus sp. FC_14]|nr:hypothetical protein F5I97DRAFT_2069731 [Phlebopus sp. FC_14]
MARSQDSFTFTVGKLDAGMAILLGERAHLIEFPSVLLPPGATTGSIVNIAVHQNTAEERKRDREFMGLQKDILETFGRVSPEPPQLEVRNVTQTSVTLQWPSLKLATAKLRSLDIYKNGQRFGSIANPLTNTSTKLSSLSLDTNYTFQLVLRTSAGTFHSNVIRVRTHTIADTSGISVCFGNVGEEALLEEAKAALLEMKAKWSDKIQIDTTHFVCTSPAVTPTGAHASGGNVVGGPGVEYQRALQLSIPVVQPQWLLACLSEKKMVPIAGYYLGVSLPTTYHNQRPQSMSQASLPSSGNTSYHTHRSAPNRASMPAPQHSSVPTVSKKPIEPTPEEEAESESDAESVPQPRKPTSPSETRHKSNGTMDRNFRFPPTPPQTQDPPPVKGEPLPASPPSTERPTTAEPPAQANVTSTVITPSSVEVPPPPPVEKENKKVADDDEVEEEVGETEEIDLR